MTSSTFYSDGYRAGLIGADYSPPSVPVYAREYSNGYWDAMEDVLTDTRRYEGSNDTNADYPN